MRKKWQSILEESIRDVAGMRKFLHVTDEEAAQLERIIARYPLCITPYYIGLVNADDPEDPIRKMCVPSVREFSEGGLTDTSGEGENTVIQGLQHKYRQTALILSTNQCAMYCRHCFRKRMVGANCDEIASHLPEMADYIKAHREINNILISGGDSFLNSNGMIEKYLQTFADIPNLEYIRFGTRTPVVLPQRMTEDDGLFRILETYCERKQLMIVTQFNHPKELTPEAVEAIKLLKKAGCIIRNQTVLLKGVNDTAQTMAALMNQLVSHGVIPYYIFQCRPVEGVQNQFQVPFVKGIDIVENAKKDMSGQAKSVRFVLSHLTGKIEIIGKAGQDEIIFKYHQAKYDRDQSRVFKRKIESSQCWLDENTDEGDL